MLVLALQFSKGSERGRTLGGYLTHPSLEVIGRANRAGRSVGSGSVSSMPSAEGSKTQMGRLPQNGREDKVRRADMSRGRILRLTCHIYLPTNAPTGSGSNRVGRMPTND
jgi:hypothetical protein